MKKLSFLLVLVMSTVLAMAQNGRIELRHETGAEITKSNFTTLRAVFSYGAIESQQVTTEKGVFSELAIEGTYAAGEIGSPELPASHQLLAVPFGATPRVTVVNYTSTDYRLSDYGIGTILPHQPSVRKDQRPEDVKFVYNAESYQHRALAVAPEATVEVQGTMRGIRIGSLVVNPVSYNPASNILRVFNDIEVEIDFEGADYAETERMLLSTYSPYFDIVYKQMFNYRQITSVYDDHPDLMAYPVHMIVIAPQNYISTLQPWINWKIQKGFDVNVYTTSQTGTSYSSIRSYVQNLYNTGVNQGKTPTFLILVGDTGQIPGTTGSSSNKVTDLYYGSTDGDYFPDMFYSRISAENTTQLTNIINKILQYEQYTMPDPSYLNKVLLIAGEDDYWNSMVAQPTINYATTYYYNASHGFTNVYAYLNSYNNCYNNLSTGVGFANYTAHGSETSWAGPFFSSSNVNSLTNTNKYFLAMGNCCQSGHFGASTACFGEAMIRAANKGAFTYIGSCPNTMWYEDYYFGVGATNTFGSTPSYNNSATGVYDAVWMDDTYNTVSSMVFLGNIAVCYANANAYQTSVSPLYYWQAYHVLGDGSIMPYRVNPTANNVSHASTISGSATSFTVNAQAGSYVGISQDNVLKGAALVPASGTVSVPITALNSGQVRIVVTKPQRQPYIQDITVSGGAPTTYSISISANPTDGGSVAFGGKERDGAWYYYDDGEYATTVGLNGQPFSWAIMIPAGSYTGNMVSKVALFDVAEWEGSVEIYNGGTTAPANLVGSMAVSCENVSDYAELVFPTPLDIDPAQNVWVVANFVSGATFAAGAGVDTGDPNGRWVEINGSWYDLADAGLPDYNWLLRVYIEQSSTISATYTQGQSCTVTATPNSGYTFSGWKENGVTVSSSASYTFTVTANRNLVANFTAAPQQYTVSVSANPTNGGTVSGGGTYTQGQSCTVTATPNSGYTFSGWKENGVTVSSNANYTFTVTANRNLVAIFTALPQQYAISVSASPTNGGTVSGGGTYTQGQSCTVTATANSGYTFSGWRENGVTVSSNANYTFTVTANRNLVAIFTALPQQYAISVSASPTNGGTVSGGGTYTQGQSCTVTATPNSGYTFSGWRENGVTVSSNANYTFTVTANRNLVAIFTALPQQYAISVSASPTNGGTVSGGGTYTQGQSCTVTATPNNGYNFINWTENGVTVSSNANYTFNVTSNRILVANFTLQTFTVTASVDPAEGGTAVVTGDNHYGATVSVTVNLNDEYSFINWTENGEVVSDNQTYEFVLTANRHLVANLLSTVGLDEQDVTVKTYPNPVSDKLTVSSDKAFNSVEVYNMMGVMVYSQKDCTDKVEIQTSQLPAGTYLIRLTTDHTSVIRRFVKE